MATTIITKFGSGAPTASDVVRGELAVDTENGRLYTEDSGGSVIEIGLNPSGNVDVTGTVTADAFEVDDTDDIRLRFLNASTFKGGIQVATTAGDMIATSAVDDLAIRSQSDILFATGGNTERMKIVDTGIDVTGTVTADGSFNASSAGSYPSFRGAGNYGGGIGFIDTNVSGMYTDTSGANLKFFTNQSASDAAQDKVAMTIDGSGNVGIGTDSPKTTLNLAADNSGQGPILTLENSATSITTNDVLGQIDFYANDGSTGGTGQKATIQAVAENSSGTSVGLIFGTSPFPDTTATERLRIDSSGNVGIGTDSQDSRLVVQSPDNTLATDIFKITSQNAAAGLKFGFQRIEQIGPTNPITFNTGGSEAMQIDSSGNLLVGTTSLTAIDGTPTTTGIGLRSTGSQLHSVNDGGNAFEFRINGTAGTVGSISCSGSSTAYNQSSDYRLKENVVAMSGATERLKQLKPSRFNFIANPDKTVDGFLAHEVQDIVPEAITGTKDAVDAEGNPEYQGIDQSKLVPLLVATIQELEARIAALEGGN